MSLALVLSLALSVAFPITALVPAIPKAHAVAPTALSVKPSTVPLATAGATVTLQVNVTNAPSMSGIDIYVSLGASAISILNPMTITLGTAIPMPFATSSCINGGIVGFSSGCDSNDGPGIVHVAFASLTGGSAAGNFTLFTIGYTAVAGPGASVFFKGTTGTPETVTINNGLNSLFDPSGFNITGVPEQAATYGSLVSPLSADFSFSPPSPSPGQTVTFTSTVSGGTTPYTYSWTFGDGGTSSAANPTHAYTAAGSFPVSLTVTDSSSPAQSKTASHTVTVSQALAADFTSSPAHPIIGGTVTLTSTVTGGKTPYTYSWMFGDGGTSTAANPTHSYTTAGSFTVSLTVTDSSSPAQTATASHSVTVASAVTADFTSSPTSPTIGQTVTFTSTVSGGTTPYTYSWTFGDGGTSAAANPTHAYTTAGPFTVTLTVTDSSTPTQTATASHTVTVSTGLSADFISSPAHPIIGGTVTFTSIVTGGTAPFTYSWTFGDGGTSAAANPTHAYTTAGSFTISLTVTDSSSPAQTATASHSVTVASAVTADFTSSPANPGIGQTVTFTSTVSGGTIPYTYAWTFGDAGTSAVASPTHSYTTAGPFTVTLTVTDSSTPAQTATATHMVTVTSGLAADFTSAPSSPTIGQTVTFTSTVTGGTTPYSYSWTFGDSGTSALASPTHSYTTAGTFTVTLTVTDSSTPTQSATASHTVTVASGLTADFTFSPSAPTTGQTVTFTSIVTGGTTPYTYSWSFGDGGTSNVANPTHAYATAGAFTVTLTVTDSSTPAQSAPATHTVTVSTGLAADFTSSPANPVIGGTVTFTSTVTGGTTPYTYSWNFGDGGTSTAANPTHAFASPGSFSVTLTVTDSSTPAQTATASHTVTVSAVLSADFTSSPSTPCVGQTVTFTSTVTGGATPYAYSWAFADGATSTVANPAHAYTTSGSFSVMLTVTDSSTPAQTSAASHSVTVAAASACALSADFTSSPANPTVSATVTFTSTVSGGTTPYTYAWTFGDGGTGAAANPTHAYATAGPFTVTLTVTDSSTPALTATASHTVTVVSALAADFVFSPLSPTTGQTVTFTSTVTGGTTPYSYSWDFGDGGTSTAVNPTHSYVNAGPFTATLTVTDSSTPAQTATATHAVTVTGAIATVTISTSLSQSSISIGGSVTDSATLSGNTATAGGTVTYYLFSTADCTGEATIISTVTVTSGVVPNSAPQTFNTVGSFSWNAVYSGDPNNSQATSGCEPLIVTQQIGKPIILTFKGFDLDDCDNGVGQLQITVNGQQVAGIPSADQCAALPSGTGDYQPNFNTWVDFGPFDITNMVVQGQNTIVFLSPPPGHFGLVKNVTIRQGDVVLLPVSRTRYVSLSHAVTFTFSVPPLVITSFTVSNSTPKIDKVVTFTASFTGGTAPFTCVFRFGDGESQIVAASEGTCSVTHDFDDSGIFNASVTVIGSSTSDRASSSLSIAVATDEQDP